MEMCQSQVTAAMKNGKTRHNRWSLISVLIVAAVQLNSVYAGVLNGTDKQLEMTNNSSVLVTTIAPPKVTTIPGETVSPERNATTIHSEQEQPDDPTTRGPARDRSHIYKNLRNQLESMPESCKNYELHPEQPKLQSPLSWFKCCPEGQMLNFTTRTCELHDGLVTKFRPPIVNATFYQDCIEDSEVINFNLKIDVFFPPNKSLMYEETQGDHLYILQNGSLLIIYDTMTSGYDIYTEYCLDNDPTNDKFFALVRQLDTQNELVSGFILTRFYRGIAAITIISFCCLLITSALYMIVPRFGTLHGRSFALHTLNLSVGYIIIAAMYFKWDGHSSKMEGNAYLQYFVSSAFLWQFVMCVDTLINVWYYIPKKISPIEGRYRGWIHFGAYVLFCQCISFLFIIHHDNDSINYYMSTVDVDHSGQWRFFGPILGIIILCIGMFVGVYYGFRKLNEIQSLAYIIRMKLRKQKREIIAMPFCSKEMEYVKDSARATCILFAIQSVCFISELITFYVTNEESIFFELINAMQGVFILLLFILMPKPLLIIRQWWSGDRGSLIVEQQPPRRPVVIYLNETEPLKNGSNDDKGVGQGQGVKGNASE